MRSLLTLEEALGGLIWQQVGLRLLKDIRERFEQLFPGPTKQMVEDSLAWWRSRETERPNYPTISQLFISQRACPSQMVYFQLPVVDSSQKELRYWWISPQRNSNAGDQRVLAEFPFDDVRRIDGVSDGPYGSVKGFKNCRIPITASRTGLSWCAAENAALYLPDLRPYQTIGQSSEPETDVLWGIGSVIYLPIESNSSVIGVLVLSSPIHGLFGPDAVVGRRVDVIPHISDFKVEPNFFSRLRVLIATLVDLPGLISMLRVIDEAQLRRQKELRQRYEIAASHEDKGRLLPALDTIRLQLLEVVNQTTDAHATQQCKQLVAKLHTLKEEVSERVSFVLGRDLQGPTNVEGEIRKVLARSTDLDSKVEIHVDSQVSDLPIHPFAFKYVLRELIYNALAAMRDRDPNFKILIIAEPGEWDLVVRDHGTGIEDDLLPRRLFEEGVSKGKKEAQHYGIGLWVVKGIIEDQYGGKIEAENWEGGAEFRIRVRR